jgi:hypothetical protein
VSNRPLGDVCVRARALTCWGRELSLLSMGNPVVGPFHFDVAAGSRRERRCR